MDRSGAGLGGTWLLSCLPVALPVLWAPAESSLGEASRLALACLPWLAWIGNPCPPRESGEPDAEADSPKARTAALLSMPPLFAAFAVDLGRGHPLPDLLSVTSASLVMIFLLAHSARHAAFTPGRALRFALAWGLLVPGLPLLRCALDMGVGRAPAWLARLADASPIAWAWACAWEHAPGSGNQGSPPWAALAGCLGLLAISGIATRGEKEGTVEVRAS